MNEKGIEKNIFSLKWVLLAICLVVLTASFYVYYNDNNDSKKNLTTAEIKLSARRASVQPLIHVPVIKISFTKPLDETPDKIKITQEQFDKAVKERKEALDERFDKLVKDIEGKIKSAIDEERTAQSEDRYETTTTDINIWGVKPVSQTFIPIASLPGVPKWAKFPERVIVAAKIEEEEISIWEKKYEKDVLAISDVANVSPAKAKEIITRIKTEGYTISKEAVKKADKVTLLWFRYGWDSSPSTLSWEVTVGEDESNIIIGYDPRGIIEVKPIPEDKLIHVKAEYFDLKDKFKEKSNEVIRFENQIEALKEMLEAEKEKLEEKEKEFQEYKEEKEKPEIIKRDITTATMFDVRIGNVKIETFYMLASGSGVFLGNMKVRDNFDGWYSSWGGYRHYIVGDEKAVILTNAHVADSAIKRQLMVSKDKEVMVMVLPGKPFIRFTKDSDHFGSPAALLAVDGHQVMSYDYDAAILVTSPVHHYEQYKALLGDSDIVEEGTRVCMVGNPSSFQKFLTEGVLSRKDYNFFDHIGTHGILERIPSKVYYNMLKNTNFWFDSPIGAKGTSGSGVFALEGEEKGKVVALHNMGLVRPLMTESLSIESGVTPEFKTDFIGDELVADAVKDKGEELFRNFPAKDAKYVFSEEEFSEKHPDMIEAMSKSRGHVAISGMNIGIPINKIKQFLQERGLDPDHFEWEGVGKKHWER